MIHADELGGASCGSSRRKRSATSCTPEELKANEETAREAVSGLTLLADDETRILIGDITDDIAFHPVSEGAVLAKVQEGVHDFRRGMARTRISEREGYHNVIVVAETNSDPLGAAIALAKGGKGRVLVYDSRDGRLQLTDGRTVSLLEGGAGNRVSLVGSADALAGFGNEELAGLVRDFCHGEI